MKRILLFAMCLLFAAPAQAQISGLRSLGYAQMNSLSAATALPSIPSGTIEAFVICETQNVRWRDDGTNPTSSVGMLLLPSQSFPYIGSLPNIRFIQTTSGASCGVTYYGY